MQRSTGASTVYRYEFDDAPPATPSHGAYHSAEIEFIFKTAVEEAAVASGRHEAFRSDVFLLDEFRQDRRSERRKLAELAGL